MNVTRVTVGSATAQSITAINAAAARLATLQNQLSSGKQISTPSDDPAGTVTALQLRGELARNTQYASNSSDATAWLSTSDSTYSQVVAALQSARTLVVQGLNSGAADSSASSAVAGQLSGVRSTLLSLANASYDGRPLFGGTTAGAAAYDASGAYVGDGGTVTRAVAAGSTVAVSSSGPAVFGSDADGTSVFALLKNISDTLSTAPTTLGSDTLSKLDAAIARVSNAQSTGGAALQQVQRAQATGTSVDTALKTQLSSIEEVDFPAVAIQLAAANTSYQAALQATASIGQLSLLSFLR